MGVTKFLTKKDFVSAFRKGRYEYISTRAQKNINECKNDNDVMIMEITTGSGLKVINAEKVDESKFIELTKI